VPLFPCLPACAYLLKLSQASEALLAISCGAIWEAWWRGGKRESSGCEAFSEQCGCPECGVPAGLAAAAAAVCFCNTLLCFLHNTC
ncbi:hypothetical protein COO60DRAFT_1543995, partial [Scenedesmus sp. NREL 46B-D3]